MEKASARGRGANMDAELGGEFPVQDLVTNQGGLLQVCMDGIGLLFANSKVTYSGFSFINIHISIFICLHLSFFLLLFF